MADGDRRLGMLTAPAACFVRQPPHNCHEHNAKPNKTRSCSRSPHHQLSILVYRYSAGLPAMHRRIARYCIISTETSPERIAVHIVAGEIFKPKRLHLAERIRAALGYSVHASQNAPSSHLHFQPPKLFSVRTDYLGSVRLQSSSRGRTHCRPVRPTPSDKICLSPPS